MLCIHYTDPDMKYIDEAKQIKIDEDRLDDTTLEDFIAMQPDRHIYINILDINLTKKIDYMRKLQQLMTLLSVH